MMAIRGRRQAASQARTSSDEISSSSSWWESISESKKEPEPQASEPRNGFFRRSRIQPRSSNVEDRNDDQQSRGRLAKRDPSGSQGKSKIGQRSKSSDRARREVTSTADANILSLRSDKRQKKVVYKSFSENPFKVLTIDVEEGPPTPKYENHVVLKIAASTVSYSDCLIRRGISFEVLPATGLPATPGMDVVGSIVDMGNEVKDYKIGDKVAALVRTGGNARYISVAASDLVTVPRACDDAEAACIVTTYMTAYQCLRLATDNSIDLKRKRVLITGGMEPVGQALIQLCFRAGAAQVFAVAPENRHRFVRIVLGAKPISVDAECWPDKIKGGMDVVFDGTCYDNFESPNAALGEEGILVSFGMSALLNRESAGFLGAPMSAYWAKLKNSMSSKSTSYEIWDSFKTDKEAYKLDLEILFHLLQKRFIKPHISRRVTLSAVAEAHHSLEQETARGEIVCLPWKRIS